MPFAILWPTFALVALIILVWFWLTVERGRHIKRRPPTAEDFATGEAALRYFTPVEMPANNFRNLFEMPVLYFAIVPLLMITHQGTLCRWHWPGRSCCCAPSTALSTSLCAR